MWIYLVECTNINVRSTQNAISQWKMGRIFDLTWDVSSCQKTDLMTWMCNLKNKTNKTCNWRFKYGLMFFKKINCSIRKNAGSANWSRKNDTCKSCESQQVCVSASRENRSLWCFCLRKSSLRELNYTLVGKCRIWITTEMLMNPFRGGQWKPVGC